MIHYKTREGIVVTKICGRPTLIPLRSAGLKDPTILPMNIFTGICWNYIEQGKTPQDICATVSKILFKTEDEVLPLVEKQLRDMCDRGYLICEEI